MELIERIPLRPIYWLSNISYDDFAAECKGGMINKPKESDIKQWYSTLQKFCDTNIKTQGITKRIYSYSITTPLGMGGRLFSGGSMQSIWNKYRGLLLRDSATDIDMCNAHPVILKYICNIHDICCPNLIYYI